MQIKIGKVEKSFNSTKQFDVGTEIEVQLKENTSIRNPVFILSNRINNIKNYNVIKYDKFYYTIKDVVFISNNVYEVYCELDRLATFKDYITNASGFVTYSSSIKKYDLDDTRLTPTSFYSSYTLGSSYLLWDSDKNQNALMTTERLDDCTVSMQINNGVSGTISYVMRFTDFKDMLGSLSDDIFANWDKILKNIKYCTLLPIEWSFMKRKVEEVGSTAQTSISLGPRTVTPCICYPIKDMRYIISNVQMDINLNEVYSQLRFKARNRWSKYQLILPNGVREINFDDIYLPESSTNLNYLSMRFIINVASGMCNLTIMNGAKKKVGDVWELPETSDSRVIAQDEWTIGSDLMGLISITESASGRLINFASTSLVPTVLGGVAGGAVGAAVGLASNAFQKALQPLDIQQGNSSFSSVGAYMNHPIVGRVILHKNSFSCPLLTDGYYGNPHALQETEKTYYDNFCSKFGYPIMEFIDLSKRTLRGFNQFEDVIFNFNKTYNVCANNDDLLYLAQTMKNGIIIE